MHYNFVCISFLSSIRPKYFRNREDSKTGGGGHWEPGFHPQFLPIYNSRRHSNGQFITIVRPPPPKFFDIPLSLESKLCFVSRWLATHPQKAVIHSDEALTLLCILTFTTYFLIVSPRKKRICRVLKFAWFCYIFDFKLSIWYNLIISP